MTNKTFSSLKIVTLAVVLSFGLSYVYAWTAPTQNPPAGNISAPINTSATAQTKAGALTVGGLALPAGSTVNGGGAVSTHGATTVQGTKTGWSGINFRDTAGTTNYGTLMMHPSYSGFFNAADNNWRWYVTDSGASVQYGTANASDFCTPGGKCLSAAGGGGAYWFSVNTYTKQFCYLGDCQKNPKTNDYSCPTGFTAVGGITGQAFRYSQWDQTLHHYVCV